MNKVFIYYYYYVVFFLLQPLHTKAICPQTPF